MSMRILTVLLLPVLGACGISQNGDNGAPKSSANNSPEVLNSSADKSTLASIAVIPPPKNLAASALALQNSATSLKDVQSALLSALAQKQSAASLGSGSTLGLIDTNATATTAGQVPGVAAVVNVAANNLANAVAPIAAANTQLTQLLATLNPDGSLPGCAAAQKTANTLLSQINNDNSSAATTNTNQNANITAENTSFANYQSACTAANSSESSAAAVITSLETSLPAKLTALIAQKSQVAAAPSADSLAALAAAINAFAGSNAQLSSNLSGLQATVNGFADTTSGFQATTQDLSSQVKLLNGAIATLQSDHNTQTANNAALSASDSGFSQTDAALQITTAQLNTLISGPSGLAAALTNIKTGPAQAILTEVARLQGAQAIVATLIAGEQNAAFVVSLNQINEILTTSIKNLTGISGALITQVNSALDLVNQETAVLTDQSAIITAQQSCIGSLSASIATQTASLANQSTAINSLLGVARSEAAIVNQQNGYVCQQQSLIAQQSQLIADANALVAANAAAITAMQAWVVQQSAQLSTPICTPQDLQKIVKNPSANFRLICDVDMQGVTWVGPNRFSGTLDGDGHTINNLAMNDKSTVVGGRNIAFLGDLTGTVQNLSFTNLSATGTDAFVTSLAFSNSFGTIKNVHVTGNLSGGGLLNSSGVSGFVYLDYGIIMNSSFAGTINSAGYAYGFVAYGEAITNSSVNVTISSGLDAYGFTDWVDGNIDSCRAVVNIRSAGNVYAFAGGIITTSTGAFHIANSFVSGTISAANRISMFASVNADGNQIPTISNSYANVTLPTVTGASSFETCLDGTRAPIVHGFYYLKPASSFDPGCGTPETASALTTKSTFVGWDFVGAWKMPVGGGTPTNVAPPAPTGLAISADSKMQLTSSWTSGYGSTAGFYVAYASGTIPPTSCTQGRQYGNITTLPRSDFAAGQTISVTVCAYDAIGNVSAGISATQTTMK